MEEIGCVMLDRRMCRHLAIHNQGIEDAWLRWMLIHTHSANTIWFQHMNPVIPWSSLKPSAASSAGPRSTSSRASGLRFVADLSVTSSDNGAAKGRHPTPA